MAFRFPLQAVLHLQKSIEKQEELRLLAINRQISRVSRLIEAGDREALAAHRRFHAGLARGLSGVDLRFEVSSDLLRRQQRGRYLRWKRQLEDERRLQQRAYREARQKWEMFDNLRSRKLTVFQREQERLAQRSLDELFQLRRHFDARR